MCVLSRFIFQFNIKKLKSQKEKIKSLFLFLLKIQIFLLESLFHFKILKNTIKNKMFSCQYCEKQFQTKYILNKHQEKTKKCINLQKKIKSDEQKSDEESDEQIEKLLTQQNILQTEYIKLHTENMKLQTEYMKLQTENMKLQTEKLELQVENKVLQKYEDVILKMAQEPKSVFTTQNCLLPPYNANK